MTQKDSLILVPLNMLKPSAQYNQRRKKHTDEEIAALAASIKAEGLINPISVVPELKAKKGAAAKPTGRYEVPAGEGRLRACLLLTQDGTYTKDELILCREVSADSARTVSYAENALRVAMHPADEFEAFKAMTDEGRSIEEVAARFRVSVSLVKQRLKLANVAPDFIELYRNDEVEIDVLEALSLTEDHDEQHRVWEALPANRRYAHYIRDALTRGEVEAKHKLARFVGIKAYEKAGGLIRRDMFAANHEGYLDRALLQSLADAKLEKARSKAQGSDAKWVDVHADYDYSVAQQYSGLPTVLRAATADEAANLATLNADLARIEAAMNSADDEEYETLSSEQDAVSEQIDAIDQLRAMIDPNAEELAGTVIGIDNNGKLVVRQNILRSADARKLERTRGGNRDVVAAPTHSDAMMRRLTAHKTFALQAELCSSPQMALAALITQLVNATFPDCPQEVGLSVSDHITDAESFGEDVADSPAAKQIAATSDAWAAVLAEEVVDGDVLGWACKQPQDRLVSLLAYLTAVRVSAVRHSESSRSEGDLLAAAIGLDMRRWWQATASSYFDALKKPRIASVIAEVAPGAIEAAAAAKLKKGELAAKAESVVAEHGSTWLPEPLRAA